MTANDFKRKLTAILSADVKATNGPERNFYHNYFS
jgi:hypothetical protein